MFRPARSRRRRASKAGGPAWTEDDFQVASKIRLDRWLEGSGVVYFHVPNGGFRDWNTAKNMKAGGVRKGVADWLLFPRDGRKFALELKTATGQQRDDQERFQTAWEATGGIYEIARSLSEIDSFILRHGIA